jgi:hypothetical protein
MAVAVAAAEAAGENSVDVSSNGDASEFGFHANVNGKKDAPPADHTNLNGKKGAATLSCFSQVRLSDLASQQAVVTAAEATLTGLKR